MNLITYAEASNILDVSVQTLKQALEPNRNVFTRAGRKGVKGLLIKEQVLLFAGINTRTGRKKRLSLDALTSEERDLWYRYASEYATSQASGAVPITPDIDRLIHDKIKIELAKQELGRIREERRAAEENARKLNEQEERFLEGRPFLMRELTVA